MKVLRLCMVGLYVLATSQPAISQPSSESASDSLVESNLLSELANVLDVTVSNIQTCDNDDLDGNDCITTLTNPDNIIVNWKVDEDYKDTTDLSSLTVALCFSPKSTEDRKWRKAKDNVDKDKQCRGYGGGMDKAEFAATVPFAASGTVPIKIEKDQPTATYFVRVYAKNEAGRYVGYGDSGDASQDHCTLSADAPGDNTCGYFKIKADIGVSAGIVVVAVIFSIVAIVTLVVAALYETYRQKPQAPEVGDEPAEPNGSEAESDLDAVTVEIKVAGDKGECVVEMKPESHAMVSHADAAQIHQEMSKIGAPGANAPAKQEMEKPAGGKAVQAFDNIKTDAEGRATELPVWSCVFPHMRGFHLSTISFFISFLSTFAAAPLMPVIRDDLNMTASDIGNGNIASVTACVFARVVMGAVCDLLGPRYGHAFMQLATAPAVALMATVETPFAFIACRFVIGAGMATFVSSQYWTSILFSASIVGTANATSGGWGNLGGGVVQFLMPPVANLFRSLGLEQYASWRCAFFLPCFLHIAIAIFTLAFGQDTPHGNYSDLKALGLMVRKAANSVMATGLQNYRSWCLFVLYACCFGVELTMNNIAASYFFDNTDWGLDLTTASLIAGSFGMMNLFARTVGGIVSDYLSQYSGMPGRLWALFVIMVAEGISCIILSKCESLGLAVLMMVVFSGFVQAAEGATYGIVPFVSRRALGVVSGLVGAGGNLGSVVFTALFFKGNWGLDTRDGLWYMGITIVILTIVFNSTIHFPMWGSMFFGGSGSTTGEEEYYSADYTELERQEGLHLEVYPFCKATKKEAGPKLNAKRGLDKSGLPIYESSASPEDKSATSPAIDSKLMNQARKSEEVWEFSGVTIRASQDLTSFRLEKKNLPENLKEFRVFSADLAQEFTVRLSNSRGSSPASSNKGSRNASRNTSRGNSRTHSRNNSADFSGPPTVVGPSTMAPLPNVDEDHSLRGGNLYFASLQENLAAPSTQPFQSSPPKRSSEDRVRDHVWGDSMSGAKMYYSIYKDPENPALGLK